MPIVTHDSESIYYPTRGTRGPAIVFIHGAGSSHLIWNRQLAALADMATCYGIDLPGHGRSTGSGRNSIEAYRDVTVAFLDTLRIEAALIVGHSMGGAIAQTLALSHPEHVAGIGLVGTGGRLRVAPEFLAGLMTDFEQAARTINRNSFADTTPATVVAAAEKELLACPPEVVLGDYIACDRFDAMNRLHEIHAPALILCGREDRMTPSRYSKFLASKIAGARLVLVEAAGHDVMLEQPDAVNRALREWIAAIA